MDKKNITVNFLSEDWKCFTEVGGNAECML